MIDKKHHIIAILCFLITLIFCNLLVYLNYASYITAIIFPILLILIFKIFKINNKIVNLFINYLIVTTVILVSILFICNYISYEK